MLGVKPEGPLSNFTGEDRIPFDIPTEGEVDVNAVVITIDSETGKALNIEQVQRIIK